MFIEKEEMAVFALKGIQREMGGRRNEMMKKAIAVFAIFLILLAAGCSSVPAPEETVERFMVAAKNFDFAAMACEIDPEAVDPEYEWEEYLSEEQEDMFQQMFLAYFRENAAKIEHEILGSETDGETAQVMAAFRYVDGAPLMREAFTQFIAEMFALAFTGAEIGEEEASQKLADIFTEKKESSDEAYVENNIEIRLVLKEGRWYVAEMSEELLNVIMSNFVQLTEEMEGFFE
jgi:hypothetical protein